MADTTPSFSPRSMQMSKYDMLRLIKKSIPEDNALHGYLTSVRSQVIIKAFTDEMAQGFMDAYWLPIQAAHMNIEGLDVQLLETQDDATLALAISIAGQIMINITKSTSQPPIPEPEPQA